MTVGEYNPEESQRLSEGARLLRSQQSLSTENWGGRLETDSGRLGGKEGEGQGREEEANGKEDG